MPGHPLCFVVWTWGAAANWKSARISVSSATTFLCPGQDFMVCVSGYVVV